MADTNDVFPQKGKWLSTFLHQAAFSLNLHTFLRESLQLFRNFYDAEQELFDVLVANDQSVGWCLGLILTFCLFAQGYIERCMV